VTATSGASANEQLMLELINRARLDPTGEAARFGITLNQGISGSGITSTPKQPLAMNDLLIKASRAHSQYMINTDQFAHSGIGDGDPQSRMTGAGYQFTGSWTWGENIAWQGTTGTANLTNFIIDEHRSLFLSPGHRLNIMNDNFREAGIGQIGGVFTSGGRNYNASMVTQEFAKTGTKVFVLGVAYNDTNGDKFYTVGEARAGVHVTLTPVGSGSGASTDGGSAGGYQAGVNAGTYNVTFSGGGLPTSMTVQATLAQNLKLDVVNGDTILTSGTIALGAGAKNAGALGVADIAITGNELANTLTGNSGANTLAGKQGADVLAGAGGDDLFVFAKGDGSDRITDFTAGGTVDEIRVVGFAGITSFATLMTHATDFGTYTDIDLGAGDHLRLDNVKVAALAASDFLFG
jgi:Ca2+-binding RTX toxin-like protein